jgi:hypothetical protein
MKFIKVHGRVIPIKDKNGSASKADPYKAHKTQAKLGAAGTVGATLALGAIHHGKLKTAVAFGAAGVGLAGTALVKRFTNSIDHGKKQKSVLSGLGRFLTLSIANSAGATAGNVGLKGVAKVARSIRTGVSASTQTVKLKKLAGGSYGY